MTSTTPPPPDRPYSPPPAGGPPWGPPPAARKRRVWPWVLLGLAVALIACAIGIGGLIASSSDSTDTAPGTGDTAAEPAEGQEPATRVTVGQAVRDGKFEFTVQKVKCGASKVGGDFGETAQGQFCLVTVKVTNIGKEAQFLSDSEQKAYDAEGIEYSTDTAAGLSANENADVFLNEINPGNSVTGVLVFDVPKGTKLTRLELHDSPFSGGITVQL